MKDLKCERCGTTKQLVEYGKIENEDSQVITCKVCDKKLSKMLKNMHWKNNPDVKNNKDYEEKIKSIVAVWKDRPLSKKEKEEISSLK
jgi:hypothetical protein